MSRDLTNSQTKNLNIIKMGEDGTDWVHAEACPIRNGRVTPGLGNENWEKNIWPYISELFSNKSSVIDIGAGNGRRSKFFSNHVSEVVAIEAANDGQYKNIVSNDIANIEYIQGDFLDYDFGNKKFDVAYCEGSFYWIGLGLGRHDEGFKKIINILKDDGGLIILAGSWRSHKDPRRKHNLHELIEDNNCITLMEKTDVKWGSQLPDTNNIGEPSLMTVIRKNNDT